MTPLPAFDEQIIERRDLPEYGVAERCCNPYCPNMANDRHEIYPRSQAVGVVSWIELPGRYLIGNRVGLCRGCHETNDAHTSQILWDNQTGQFAWIDFKDRNADFLNPSPPIHKLAETDVDAVARGEEQPFVPTSEPAGGVEGMREPSPALSEPVQTERENGDPGQEVGLTAGSEAALLARRVRATDELLAQIEENLPSVDEAITPIVVPQLPEPEVLLPKGDEPATIARAQAATEEAGRQAASSTVELPPAEHLGFPWWRGTLAVNPETLETKVLEGDVRVKIWLDEMVEKAKKAPKPRAPRPPEDPDRPREPAKERRTWSIAVPLEARSAGLLELAEDGYSEIEEHLENLRQRFGDDDAVGWKFRVLIKTLAWMDLNYTDEGED